ncbi:kinase-like domain-containing protein [Aspergillus pseudocaelatus]|uniref:Altered inheritance of mitochondria protein 9, mitochondrial n=1 Tax=Aspergillus pseudocaelatus TaxID=1825620 RepID=A0ABQ6WLH5_9EURO|nr:kinase-like domain-containing protein [Aspergillus pseudocaelatus]
MLPVPSPFSTILDKECDPFKGSIYKTVSLHSHDFNLDPHSYTKREARYIKFDFDALCRRVLELTPAANAITACQKIEGGFNRVFIFHLSNAKRIVARLPFTLAGPARLTTASEVATIKYLQAKTRILIPTILDWSDNATDDCKLVGTEYSIMEHVDGVQLHQKWQSLAGDQKIRCIKGIHESLKEVVNLEFPAFGSLYFSDGPLDPGKKGFLDENFYIGPHCGPRYWNCNVGERRYYDIVRPNHGPWSNNIDFSDGLIDVGLSRVPPAELDAESRPSYHGSIQAHLTLLGHARKVLKQMSADPRIQNAATSLLFHPDLHKRNIFVSEDDPSIVTGIIDWQAASIEPSWWYADEVPNFAMHSESGSNLCRQAFEACTQFLTPRLAGPRLINDSLFRPFRYSYRTWKDGAVALRDELIGTAQHWEELGFAGQCAYPLPTPMELARHKKQFKLFEAAHDLKGELASLLGTATDGWMPPGQLETTKEANMEIFQGILHEVLTNEDTEDEPVTDEAILRSIWPFDLDR